jgi:hypothetical protein
MAMPTLPLHAARNSCFFLSITSLLVSLFFFFSLDHFSFSLVGLIISRGSNQQNIATTVVVALVPVSCLLNACQLDREFFESATIRRVEFLDDVASMEAARRLAQ